VFNVLPSKIFNCQYLEGFAVPLYMLFYLSWF
jgi:hypothetical protein